MTWRVASPKPRGLVGRLVIQIRIIVATIKLTGESEGWKLRQNPWSQNFFFSGVSQSLLLRPSADWMRPTPIVEGNWLYSKFTNVSVNHIFFKKMPS